MNHRWSGSSSNIVPCCRNNNLARTLPKNDVDSRSIGYKKKYIEQMNCAREPLSSVQMLQKTRAEIPLSAKCKSKLTDKCYAEYNINCLRQGFGQVKDIRNESAELGQPSLVIQSSALGNNENDIVIFTNYVLKELGKTELRKRFALVHTEKYIYVVGGYIYDPNIPARTKTSHDYKYDVQSNELIPIQPLPNGASYLNALGFGLCIDDNFIYAIGGNDMDNRPLSDCYGLNIRESNETWIKLPDLPAPTSGPGVGVYEGQIHCVGGFDVLGSESIAHGEYLVLRYPQDKQWRYAPEINVTRSRPLVLVIPDNSISGQSVYVAGGYNVNPNMAKPYVVSDLQLFNQSTQRWQRLTTIPNLQLTHTLSFADNKLHVSETTEVPNRPPVTNILHSFDLRTLTWTNNVNKKMNAQTTQSSSAFIPSPYPNRRNTEIKTHPNNQINTTKTSTLKIPTAKIQQNNIKSGITKTSEMDQRVANQIKARIKSSSKQIPGKLTSKNLK